MDPLSVTSGIVGIVAFAFQLAKTASKVRTAVEEIKSAPKEARDLIERLVILETACQLISVHLERRKALPDHSLLASSDIIAKALAQCLAKAQEMEQMLSSLSAGKGSAWTLRPKVDTAYVSRIRLVLRKDKINSLLQEIERVTSLLQFVIHADMWTLTSIPQQQSSRSGNGTELMDQSLEPGKDSRIAKARRAKHQHRRTFRYLGYITWTIADGWIGEDDEDDGNRIAYRKGSIVVRLPFTPTQINIHYDVGIGTPSYALNIVHIIEKHSELGMRVREAMELGDGVRDLHEMISNRELSIYSKFRSYGQEMNLFFMAVSLRWAAGCRYLLQHDFRHEFEEANPPPVMLMRYDPPGAYEVTELFLSIRPQEMLETDMRYLLDVAVEPTYFLRYLKAFMKPAGIDCANFVSYAWVRLIRNISLMNPEAFSVWIPTLHYIIEQGVDICQPVNNHDKSAYQYFLGGTDHPFTADDRAYTWLKMLKACDVDLGSYIAAEIALVQKFGLDNKSDRRKRTVVLLNYDGLQIPSWRWVVPTESSAVEAFEEFMNIGSEPNGYLLRAVYPTGPDDFKAWKRWEDNNFWTRSCFPFCLYPIDCIVGTGDYRLDGRWCRVTYDRAVEIRDKRFMRRQIRKWRKGHPGKESSSERMPGTWVD